MQQPRDPREEPFDDVDYGRLFETAKNVLLAGAWMIENGYGRLALLPYVYATGHWRCEFHLVGRPSKTLFRYSIASGHGYLTSHSGGTVPADIRPEDLAKAILVSVPNDLESACAGPVTRETQLWIKLLKRELQQGRVPQAFGEYFGRKDTWQLVNFGAGSVSEMPAIPGYVLPGGERSVLDEPYWRAAELWTNRLIKRPIVSILSTTLKDDEACYSLAMSLKENFSEVDSWEAIRLVRSAVGALGEGTLEEVDKVGTPILGRVSIRPSPDPVIKLATRVLSMVHELHKIGLQKLRVACGWDASGKEWRMRLLPDFSISDDGWSPNRETPCADYSTAQGKAYFGWHDAKEDDARALANKFIERFPALAARCAGLDWGYAGWFALTLGKAERGDLPAFYGGTQLAVNDLPPPPLSFSISLAPEFGAYGDTAFIPNEELDASLLPKTGAEYEQVWPFCLSFDGCRGGLLSIPDCFAIAENTLANGIGQSTLDALRTAAFIHQRQLKNDANFTNIETNHPSMTIIHSVIEEIRRRI